jgi:hypothetical protein
MSMTDSVGKNRSTHASMLDLNGIQATVLRLRPAPYFGSHVALRDPLTRFSDETGRR